MTIDPVPTHVTQRARAAYRVMLAAALIVAAASGCAGNGDASACETAIRADFDNARANPDAPPADKPAACAGLTDAQLEEIAGRVLAEQFDDAG